MARFKARIIQELLLRLSVVQSTTTCQPSDYGRIVQTGMPPDYQRCQSDEMKPNQLKFVLKH